uniref:Uncharacterized protein n=1 Tax=Arundo donax TaxID=35708 RepID=A0A0A9DGD1_ARUDO
MIHVVTNKQVILQPIKRIKYCGYKNHDDYSLGKNNLLHAASNTSTRISTTHISYLSIIQEGERSL